MKTQKMKTTPLFYNLLSTREFEIVQLTQKFLDLVAYAAENNSSYPTHWNGFFPIWFNVPPRGFSFNKKNIITVFGDNPISNKAENIWLVWDKRYLVNDEEFMEGLGESLSKEAIEEICYDIYEDDALSMNEDKENHSNSVHVWHDPNVDVNNLVEYFKKKIKNENK